jgi:hypothetical protein
MTIRRTQKEERREGQESPSRALALSGKSPLSGNSVFGKRVSGVVESLTLKAKKNLLLDRY